MNKTCTLKALLKIGGSLCVVLPRKFCQRNYLENDKKIIVIDNMESIEIKKMSYENLKKHFKTGE